MSINLDKFKYDLVEGWREVMDSKNSIDWAIFGYDGHSFDLKLVSKGYGGLDEMVDNFNSGRIMYGLCRVKIKDRNLEKIALINWQGEGAPLARKGTCANHVNTVKYFFKGVHVTINARTEEDVDPDTIRASISKSTSAEGVRSSAFIETDEKMEPVGAVYKRVNPIEEINAKAKDEFWRKEEVEEENRKKAEQGRASRFSQNEVKLLRKESQEYFDQEHLEKTVTSTVFPLTPSPTPSPPVSTNGDVTNRTTPSSDSGVGIEEPSSPTFSNTFVAAEKAAVLKASIPRKPAENLVRQRIKSFDAQPNERPLLFNAPTTNGGLRASSKSPPLEVEQLSVMKRKALFESGKVSNTSQTIVRKDPAQEIKSLQEESLNQMKSVAAKPSMEAERMKSPPPAVIPPPPPQQYQNLHQKSTSSQPPAQSTVKSQTPAAVKAYNLPFHIGGGVSIRMPEKMNKSSFDSDGEKLKQNGDSLSSVESNSNPAPIPKISPASQSTGVTVAATAVKAEYQADPIPQHITTNFEVKVTTEIEELEFESKGFSIPNDEPPKSHVSGESRVGYIKEELEDSTVQSGEITKSESLSPVPGIKEEIFPSPNGTTSFVIQPEMGLCARALYDYQAADETEITFDPGEIITNIQTIDEGWWEGIGPGGAFGLFPSNYVELLN